VLVILTLTTHFYSFKDMLKFVNTRSDAQLTEDGVITDSGQNVRKSVGEESEPGRDSVTAPLLQMVVRSVLVTKVKLRFVTRTLVQVSSEVWGEVCI
jgi:hypothetical protein